MCNHISAVGYMQTSLYDLPLAPLRHLYALYCLFQRLVSGELNPGPDDPAPYAAAPQALPRIFTDPGWELLSTSIISTSNCGNPALRLFGFGPVAAAGYGLGYIIKEDGISVCASSKHLQTRRFLDVLEGYLNEVNAVMVEVYRAANQRPEPWVDHAGVLRDSKTGRRIGSVNTNGGGYKSDSGSEEEEVSIRECIHLVCCLRVGADKRNSRVFVL